MHTDALALHTENVYNYNSIFGVHACSKEIKVKSALKFQMI